MAIITDIEKLRPELLTKSPAELERLATEIALAQAELTRRAEVEAKKEIAERANQHIEAIVDGVKFLHENGILPAKIAEAFSRGDGYFVPGMMLRTVSAESLVPRAARSAGPKRHRRTKAEIEAMKAAGTYKPRRRAT